MALGKINWHNETRAEQKIRQLDDELKVIELYKGNVPIDVSGNEAESYFQAWVKGRHGHRVLRAGWPDFLLKHKTTGEVFGVEVKSETDRLSRSQARCFALLGEAGLNVYVWSPTAPKVLTPWRAYLKRTQKFRADNGGGDSHGEEPNMPPRW